MYFTVAPLSPLGLGRADQVAAGAAIVQHQLRPPGDGVASVGDLGRLDDPGRDQLDAVVGAEAGAGVTPGPSAPWVWPSSTPASRPRPWLVSNRCWRYPSSPGAISNSSWSSS